MVSTRYPLSNWSTLLSAILRVSDKKFTDSEIWPFLFLTDRSFGRRLRGPFEEREELSGDRGWEKKTGRSFRWDEVINRIWVCTLYLRKKILQEQSRTKQRLVRGRAVSAPWPHSVLFLSPAPRLSPSKTVTFFQWSKATSLQTLSHSTRVVYIYSGWGKVGQIGSTFDQYWNTSRTAAKTPASLSLFVSLSISTGLSSVIYSWRGRIGKVGTAGMAGFIDQMKP